MRSWIDRLLGRAPKALNTGPIGHIPQSSRPAPPMPAPPAPPAGWGEITSPPVAGAEPAVEKMYGEVVLVFDRAGEYGVRFDCGCQCRVTLWCFTKSAAIELAQLIDSEVMWSRVVIDPARMST